MITGKVKWSEMSQQEKDKQVKRDNILFILVVWPSFFISFFVVFAITDFFWTALGDATLKSLGMFLVLATVATIFYWLFFKVGKKLGFE